MVNRQTWTLTFWTILPHSGVRTCYRADVKVKFLDDTKTLGVFDVSTLNWWNDAESAEGEDWEHWKNFQNSVANTLGVYALSESDLKAKRFNVKRGHWDGFNGMRKSRS